MNPTPLYPRTSGAPSAFSPVYPQRPPSGNVAPIAFNAGMPVRPQPVSLAIISSGDWPFDQATLEAPEAQPHSTFSTLYCNQLPGETPIERGRALLDEIARRKASGEFGPQTLVVLMLHGGLDNGELMLCDATATLCLPAATVLGVLAHGSRASADTGPVAPIVLSACHAELIVERLDRLERPVLVNGGRHALVPSDAQAVLQACVRHAEVCWREGRTVEAASLFDTLSSVSGEVLHLRDSNEWIEHRLLESSASLHDIDPRQAGLHIDAMLSHGSADELAESLLLFGLQAFRRISPSMPPLHRAIGGCNEELIEKVQLLLAIGEDVNETDDDGDTALHWACMIDPEWLEGRQPQPEELVLRHDLARRLLENGADPKLENEAGLSPEELAANFGQPLAYLLRPDNRMDDKSQQRTEGLRDKARRQGWESVISLLADPQQIADGDDDDSYASDDDNDTSDAATPNQISENSDS